MKKWIKTNNNNDIIDVFFDYQKLKFDGTEIFLENTEIIKHKINDKSISNEVGTFIFTWDGSIVSEKNQATIDSESLPIYKILKRDELKSTIKENWLDIDKTYDQIKTQWSNFKSAVMAANTKEKVDTLFDNAYTWLGL